MTRRSSFAPRGGVGMLSVLRSRLHYLYHHHFYLATVVLLLILYLNLLYNDTLYYRSPATASTASASSSPSRANSAAAAGRELSAAGKQHQFRLAANKTETTYGPEVDDTQYYIMCDGNQTIKVPNLQLTGEHDGPLPPGIKPEQIRYQFHDLINYEMEMRYLQERMQKRQQHIDEHSVQQLIDQCVGSQNDMLTRVGRYQYSSQTVNDLFLGECYPLEINLSAQQRDTHMCTLASYFIYYTNARLSFPNVDIDKEIYRKHAEQCRSTTYLHINEHINPSLLEFSELNYWLLTEPPSQSERVKLDEVQLLRSMLHGSTHLVDGTKVTYHPMQRLYTTRPSVHEQVLQYVKTTSSKATKKSEIDVRYIGYTLPDPLKTRMPNEHMFRDMQRALFVAETYNDKKLISSILQCWYRTPNVEPRYPALTIIDNTDHNLDLKHYTQRIVASEDAAELDDEAAAAADSADEISSVQILSGKTLTQDDLYLLKRFNGVHLLLEPSPPSSTPPQSQQSQQQPQQSEQPTEEQKKSDANGAAAADAAGHIDADAARSKYYTAVQEARALGACIVTNQPQQQPSHTRTATQNDVVLHEKNGYLMKMEVPKRARSKLFPSIKDVLNASQQRNDNMCKRIDDFLRADLSTWWGDQQRAAYDKEKKLFLTAMQKLNVELLSRRHGRVAEEMNEDDLKWLVYNLDFNVKRRYLAI